MKGPNRNLKVVIDSAGDLPDGWSDTFAINVIPINIHFGEKTYLQGVDLTDSQFYHMAVSYTDPEIVMGGAQDNGTFFRSDASDVWQGATGGDGCEAHGPRVEGLARVDSNHHRRFQRPVSCH